MIRLLLLQPLSPALYTLQLVCCPDCLNTLLVDRTCRTSNIDFLFVFSFLFCLNLTVFELLWISDVQSEGPGAEEASASRRCQEEIKQFPCNPLLRCSTPHWAVSVNRCSVSSSISPLHQPTLCTSHVQRRNKRGQCISGGLFLFPLHIQQPAAPARRCSLLTLSTFTPVIYY